MVFAIARVSQMVINPNQPIFASETMASFLKFTGPTCPFLDAAKALPAAPHMHRMEAGLPREGLALNSPRAICASGYPSG